MKSKITYLLFILFSLSINVNAQQENNKEKGHEHHKHNFNIEEFKQQKAAFIIKEVGLTKEESKSFIPLTEELMKRKFELNKNIRQERRNLRAKKSGTNAEYEQLINNILDTQIKEAELDKEYYQKYRKIISAEKLYKYYIAEKHFVRKFVNTQKSIKK